MISSLLEVLGFACLVACAFFVFWPAALGVLGVGLIVGAQGIGQARQPGNRE